MHDAYSSEFGLVVSHWSRGERDQAANRNGHNTSAVLPGKCTVICWCTKGVHLQAKAINHQ